MISPADIAILGAVALMLFGPEQLPRVARKAGNVMREMQNTSQAFIREMERAADLSEAKARAADPAPAALAPVMRAAEEPAFPLPHTYEPLLEHHAGPVPPELAHEPAQTTLLPELPAEPTLFDEPKRP